MRSILVFSVHKAGTMFLHRLTDYVAHQVGMTYYSTNKGNLPSPRVLAKDLSCFNNKTGCFGPLRRYFPIENIDNYSIILHVRDPRDVLVSLYFMNIRKTRGWRGWMRNVVKAYPYPHIWQLSARELFDMGALQLKRLAGWKKYRSLNERSDAIQASGIDAYVLREADKYQELYRTYCEKLLGKSNVTFLRYEDMVLDFDSWYADFARPFGDGATSAIDGKVRERLLATFKPGTEDRKSHKRKVTPGDHRDKLKPETIEALNEKFADVLQPLGYKT